MGAGQTHPVVVRATGRCRGRAEAEKHAAASAATVHLSNRCHPAKPLGNVLKFLNNYLAVLL
jgi:hypothetical protein